MIFWCILRLLAEEEIKAHGEVSTYCEEVKFYSEAAKRYESEIKKLVQAMPEVKAGLVIDRRDNYGKLADMILEGVLKENGKRGLVDAGWRPTWDMKKMGLRRREKWKKLTLPSAKTLTSFIAASKDLNKNWLLETEEGRLTLTALEDSGVTDEIDFIEEIANDPETPWEDCDEDDVNYITLWLSMWGITSARNFWGGFKRWYA